MSHFCLVHLLHTCCCPTAPITVARDQEGSFWSSTVWLCLPTKDWSILLGFPSARHGFLLLSSLVLFQIKRHERTWCKSRTDAWGLNTAWDVCVSESPSGQCPQPAGSQSSCTHTHANCGLHLWGMSGKMTCKAKRLQKSLCSFASHGCFLLLRSYTLLWRLFAAKPSICAAARQSFHQICVTLSNDYLDISNRNFLVWANSLYRWEYC